MDIDRALLSIAVRGKGTSLLVNLGVQATLFEGEAKQIWKFVYEHWRKYDFSISEDEFTSRFPGYGLVDPEDPPRYFVDRAKDRFRHNALSDAIRSAVTTLKTGDASAALESLRSTMATIDDVSSESADYDWRLSIPERLSEYETVKTAKGIDGLKTPFANLDQCLGGFHGGELIFIAARSGTGKSWLEVVLAAHNLSEGVSSIVFTKEMTAKQIARRLDARVSGSPYARLRSGTLSEDEERRMRENLSVFTDETVMGGAQIIIVGDEHGGVSSIASKIEKYKPDIVYIDGMYLLDDDRRAEAEWMRMQNVAMDLKRLAQKRNIPIVASLQFNNDNRIAGADLSRWGDVILALDQNEDQRYRKMMTLRIEKHREGTKGSFELVWDIDSMTFEEASFDAASGQATDVPAY